MNPLQTMVDEVRGRLLRQLDKTADAEMRFAPPGLQNHVAWHAGHCLWVMDRLAVTPLAGRSELPDGWGDTYGKDCRPPSQTAEWASREELIGLLARQRDRLIELLAGIEGERFDAPVGPDGSQTLGRRIIHGLHDEASHQGEIQVLRKMQRVGQ